MVHRGFYIPTGSLTLTMMLIVTTTSRIFSLELFRDYPTIKKLRIDRKRDAIKARYKLTPPESGRGKQSVIKSPKLDGYRVLHFWFGKFCVMLRMRELRNIHCLCEKCSCRKDLISILSYLLRLHHRNFTSIVPYSYTVFLVFFCMVNNNVKAINQGHFIHAIQKRSSSWNLLKRPSHGRAHFFFHSLDIGLQRKYTITAVSRFQRGMYFWRLNFWKVNLSFQIAIR